mgnify:CR=1 FL=1
MEAAFIHTPLGLLRLSASENGLISIQFRSELSAPAGPGVSHPVLKETVRQLTAYFEGKLTAFDLPLAPPGTAFQQRVWEALQEIPFGHTMTYMELSKKLGDAKAIRAVGRANGQNCIPIVIPCHRVIGSDNKLIGYAGGIERKQQLLQHEGALLL